MEHCQNINDAPLSSRLHGIAKLYGYTGLKILQQSHVAIIGIGGVGSWAVEALARSGIGHITLVDLDDICETNINRQIHSLTQTVGKSKIEVMKERIYSINPEIKVNLIHDFLTPETLPLIFNNHNFDYVFDAIDSLDNKCFLAAHCFKNKIPLFIAGGAGGVRDIQSITISDLNKCHHDKLLMRVRKKLRRDFHFPQGKKVSWGIDAVFSPSPRFYPQKEGEVAIQRDPDLPLKLDCQTGFGTSSFITGMFGFMAAAHIIEELLKKFKK